MDWLKTHFGRVDVADEASRLARQWKETRHGSPDGWRDRVADWIARAGQGSWLADEGRQAFEVSAAKAREADPQNDRLLAWHLEALERVVRSDGHAAVRGRTEPERRFALVEHVRRVPEGYIATERGIEEDTGWRREEVATLIDWALDRDLVKKKTGAAERGRHLLVTSSGREWAAEEPKNLASAQRGRRAQSVSDWTLDLTFVRDPEVRAVLEAKAAELAIAREAVLPMASVVLAGAISEGILYDALVARKALAMASPKAPKCKGGVKDIEAEEWKFFEYIEVAVDLGLLKPHSAQMVHKVLREFRNMIHPKLQAQKDMRPEEPEMNACIAWLEALARDVSRAP